MKKVIRVLIIIIILFFLIYGVIKKFDWSIYNTSDVLFIIGLPTFLIGLIDLTGANKAFIGMAYVMKSVFGNIKKEYPKFSDYYEEKIVSKKTNYAIVVIAISIILLILSFVFARMV